MNPELVAQFHTAYYNAGAQFASHWMGTKVVKCPTDMWEYQEIVAECRPQVIVETGTAWGGSALFFAHLFDIVGEGEVITVDIGRMGTAEHPRITYLTGDSPSLAPTVKDMIGERSCMVVLDSDHRSGHVAAELASYGPLVTSGQYLVVEDTNLGWLADLSFTGNGPKEALDDWLPDHPEFVVDMRRERHGLTMNPGGWLKRS
jgi:cephalosporin hydroxylase